MKSSAGIRHSKLSYRRGSRTNLSGKYELNLALGRTKVQKLASGCIRLQKLASGHYSVRSDFVLFQLLIRKPRLISFLFISEYFQFSSHLRHYRFSHTPRLLTKTQTHHTALPLVDFYLCLPTKIIGSSIPLVFVYTSFFPSKAKNLWFLVRNFTTTIMSSIKNLLTQNWELGKLKHDYG